MSTQTISETAVASFRHFVSSTSPEEMYQANGTLEPTTLAEYIRAWVGWNGAAYDCLGDFQNYLTGVIAINEWTRDPGLLVYAGANLSDPGGDVRRQVSSIFGDGVRHLDDILDPHFFAAATFHALHPRTDDQQ